MDFEKIIIIINLSIFKNFYDVQIFLDFTNYYSRFIESYARRTKSIINFLIKMRNGRKTDEFSWSD
jgi:hypothetical protein